MKSIQQHVCSFLPEDMLRNIAETSGISKAAAIATLEEMERLSTERPHLLLGPSPKAAAPAAALRRNVYDARGREKLPGTLVMSDRNAKRGKDAAVNEAWDGAGATYDFFRNVFGRNSIDDRGLRIDSTVHYGLRFSNALWHGEQIVYGDGDGKLFNRFTVSPEVIGHELTHGVTQFTAGLGYQGENGALNEHISDAFGIMLTQYRKRQTAAQSDWLIGAGLFAPGVKGKAVRSMAAPGSAYDDPRLGKDPQPRHMDHYVDTPADHGGVHINSGIPNHAFYLAAKDIGGYTADVLGPVWYFTVKHRTAPGDGFLDFADATTRVALERFGEVIARKIAGAWERVGLTPTTSTRERKAS